MGIMARHQGQINIEEAQMEEVSELRYLGSYISKDRMIFERNQIKDNGYNTCKSAQPGCQHTPVVIEKVNQQGIHKIMWMISKKETHVNCSNHTLNHLSCTLPKQSFAKSCGLAEKSMLFTANAFFRLHVIFVTLNLYFHRHIVCHVGK